MMAAEVALLAACVGEALTNPTSRGVREFFVVLYGNGINVCFGFRESRARMRRVASIELRCCAQVLRECVVIMIQKGLQNAKRRCDLSKPAVQDQDGGTKR
jgi:hypothetical protein